MKSRTTTTVLVSLVVLVSVGLAEPARVGTIAGEAGGAMVLGAVTGTVAGAGAAFAIYNLMNDQEWGSTYAVYGFAAMAPVGAILGTAGGTAIVGEWKRQHGSFGWSVVGSSVGAVLSVGCVVGELWAGEVRRGGFNVWDAAFLPLAFLAPPAGAVFGYNLSRRSGPDSLALLDRVGPPSASLMCVPIDEQTSEVGLDLRLISLRF